MRGSGLWPCEQAHAEGRSQASSQTEGYARSGKCAGIAQGRARDCGGAEAAAEEEGGAEDVAPRAGASGADFVEALVPKGLDVVETLAALVARSKNGRRNRNQHRIASHRICCCSQHRIATVAAAVVTTSVVTISLVN